MVETRMLAECKNGLVKICTYDIHRLHGELPARLACDERGRKHEFLEWLQTYAVHEPCQIEGAEYIPFALIYSITESVCKVRVACEALGLLGEEAEGESGRIVERSRCGSIRESAGRLEDEAADEMEVRVDTMLLGQLNNGGWCREGENPSATTLQTNRTHGGGLTERISCWFLSKFSSVKVESKNTI